jgi:hypothetical protein
MSIFESSINPTRATPDSSLARRVMQIGFAGEFHVQMLQQTQSYDQDIVVSVANNAGLGVIAGSL